MKNTPDFHLKSGVSRSIYSPKLLGALHFSRTLRHSAVLSGRKIDVSKLPFVYSHSIVRNYLQFVPVCLSLSHLHPVSKNAANPWGQIWVTGFGAGQGAFVGHSGSRKLASGLSRCFDCMAREKQQAGPVPAARFPQAGIARPLPPESTGRLRSWRRIHWPTESPRQHPGVRAGPLRGRRTSHPIPFAWQWPAARPAPACRRKASGRRPSQP